jgi:hypothetical protein
VERGILVFATGPRDEETARRYVALDATLPIIPGALPCAGCDQVNERIKNESASRSVGEELVEFFGDPACAACEKFLRESLPALERKLGRKIPVALYSPSDPDALDYLGQEMGKRGLEIQAFPIVIAGREVFQGQALLSASDAVLAAALAGAAPPLPEMPQPAPARLGLIALPLLAAEAAALLCLALGKSGKTSGKNSSRRPAALAFALASLVATALAALLAL